MGSLNWRSYKFSQQLLLKLLFKLDFFSSTAECSPYKRNKKFSQKRCKSTKNCLTVDIARDRSKTLKKKKEKPKMRKSQTKPYILIKNIFEETQFILLHSRCRFFTSQFIGNVVTSTPIQIFIGFVDAILRSKILGNRLGISSQILIAMDYLFYLYISDKYLQFRKKSILIWAINFIIKSLTKGIEILAKRLFSFFIIVFSMKLLFVLFIRKKSICQRIFLVHPIQVTGSTYCGIFFQTTYTSMICT